MESTANTAAVGRAVDATTLTEALRRTAANHPEIVAVRTPDDSVSLTWAELLGRVHAAAGGLAGLGVRRGDTVAIMLGNRPEFHIVDLAAATLGATPFSIYVTYPQAEIEYLCSDAQCKVAIIEQAFLPVVLAARANLQALEHLIVVDGDPNALIMKDRHVSRVLAFVCGACGYLEMFSGKHEELYAAYLAATGR